jgi:uncharacterized protein (TIGR02145 family)
MKTKIILSVLVLTVMASVYGQNPTIELTFTAINHAAYVQLDSIKVMNRTQGGDNVLYWPDTTLTIGITPGDLLLCIGYSTGYPVGLQEIYPKTPEFTLFQNYPNPVKDQSIISMFIPEKGIVNVMVTDVQGKLIISSDWQLDKGNHSFRFTPGDGSLFLLTARWNGVSRSVKILMSEPNSGKQCMLDYIGRGNGEPLLKAALHRTGFMQESGILDTPETNETYTFEFATNIPCPGTPTVTYEGQVYNTIQIFSQCWLKESLNVGTMIPGTQEMSNNSVIEKYCYNNEQDSCTKYGGYYQWDEMMQYTLQQGVQGICPSGWHLPTDEEWKVLEGAVDTQYGIGDPEWDLELFNRGFDAGTNLKSTSGWNYEGNGTDLFGFSGLPGGARYGGAGFYYIGVNGYWWASTEENIYFFRALLRALGYGNPEVYRNGYNKFFGVSVRCLRDN